MRFGVVYPSCMEGLAYNPPFVTDPEMFIRWAKEAERLGFDSLFPNDHFHTQDYVKRAFPDPPNYFDPLLVLTYVVSETERIRFCTGIAVLPIREPIVLAKQAMTLDYLSKGRLTLGVGLGAYKEEFATCRPAEKEKKTRRGDLVDEGIEALRVLFTQKKATYQGKHYRFEGVEMYPKPVQNPLPIYPGGNSFKVVERVVKYGQGWFGACLTVEELISRMDHMRACAEKSSRDISDLDIAPQFVVSIATTREEAVKRFRESHLVQHLESLKASTFREQKGGGFEERNLAGSPDDIIERISAYASAGVTSLPGQVFLGKDEEEVYAGMELYASKVMPAFR